MWEQVVNVIDKITNHPLTIAICSILTFLLPLFYLFKNSSVGKKSLKHLNELGNRTNQTTNETLEKVKDVEFLANQKINELKADYEQKVEDLKSEYEQKDACLISITNFYVETTFNALEKIPNANVQQYVKEAREGYERVRKEITSVIGEIYQDYNLSIEEVKQELANAYESKIAYLEGQIKQITLYVNEIKEGKVDGEGQETKNTNTGSETPQESE